MSKDGLNVIIASLLDTRVYVYERKPCHSSCATCSGPNANDCLTCVNGIKTPATENVAGTCIYTAASSCLDSKLLSSTSCATCNQQTADKYLNRTTGTCQASCDPVFSLYLDFPYCEVCPAICKTCDGLSRCLTCFSNQAINPTTKMCENCRQD